MSEPPDHRSGTPVPGQSGGPAGGQTGGQTGGETGGLAPSLSDIDDELGDLPIGLSDPAVEAAPKPAQRIKVSPQNDPGFRPEIGGNRLRPFDDKPAARHEDNWNRTPNATGTGAIHCRTFHCKLSSDSLDYLDDQINNWLDKHPQYEVKFVTTSTGEWGGKMGTETHLIVQVWV